MTAPLFLYYPVSRHTEVGRLTEEARGPSLEKGRDGTAQKVGEIALEGARPLEDNVYKVDLAKSLIQRALLASV